MLRSLTLSLALSLGACYLETADEVRYVPDERVDVCVGAYAPIQYCEYYYEWVPGYYSWPYDYWHAGHYRTRPGWRFRHPQEWYHRPPIVRDHRHETHPIVHGHRR